MYRGLKIYPKTIDVKLVGGTIMAPGPQEAKI